MALTLRFVPYADIDRMESQERIKKLLDIAKEDKVVLLEGRLKKEEEAALIEMTMQEIDEKFRGIELAVIENQQKDIDFFMKIKNQFIGLLLGDRQGFTIIGPATIIKEIKQYPERIELFTLEGK